MAVTANIATSRTQTNPSGGKVGSAGTDFKLKLWGYRFRATVPIEDTTGDGDGVGVTVMETNNDLYLRVTLTGAMIASQAIGLANLADAAKNPTTGLVIALTSNRKITIDMLIEAVNLDGMNRQRRTGRVDITGYMTATTLASIEAAIT